MRKACCSAVRGGNVKRAATLVESPGNRFSDAGSIPACSTIYLGVRQLVDGVIWGHEAVGSSPTTQTI